MYLDNIKDAASGELVARYLIRRQGVGRARRLPRSWVCSARGVRRIGRLAIYVGRAAGNPRARASVGRLVERARRDD